jgi:hypothetical protein
MHKFLFLMSLLGAISHVSVASDAIGLKDESFSPLCSPSLAVFGGSSRSEWASNLTFFPFSVNIKSLAANGLTFVEVRFPVSRDTSVRDFKGMLMSALRFPANARITWKSVEIMKTCVNAPTGEPITLSALFSGIIDTPTLFGENDGSQSPVRAADLKLSRGKRLLSPQLDGKVTPGNLKLHLLS